MKKLLTLLDKLEEPYRTQALNNVDPEFYEEHKSKEEPIKTPIKALAVAFDWWQTEQGYDYWLDVLTRTK